MSEYRPGARSSATRKVVRVKGQRVGYIRVSSSEQNPERQLIDIQVDRTFTDMASGRTMDRPQLDELRKYVRDGDTVIVHSIDRLARSVVDLRRITDELTEKGVTIEFVKERLTYTLSPSPFAQLTLDITAAFAEFERSIIRERQREGIAIAKAKGKYKGRNQKLSPVEAESVVARATAGEKKSALAREFHVSRETIHRYLRAAPNK